MADKKQKIILSFVVDKASLKQAQTAIAGLNKSFTTLDKSAGTASMASVAGVKDIEKAVIASKSSVAELSDELSNRVVASAEEVKRIMAELGNVSELTGKEGKKAFRDLNQEAVEAAEEFKKILIEVNDLEGDTPQALKKITKEVTNLNKQLKVTGKEVGEIPKGFDEVSREVAAFGDVESAGRTVGGAIGVIPGLEGVETAIAAISEIPASLEALPKLVSSAKELPAAGLAAAQAIGPVGVGLAAAALAAGVIFSQVAAGMAKDAEAAKTLIDVEEDFFEILVNGTKETAQAAIEEKQRQLEVLRLRQESLQQLSEDANNTGNALKDIVGAFSTTDAEEYENALDAVNQQIDANVLGISELRAGLAQNAFASETAEQQLARVTEALNKASQAAITFAEARRQQTLAFRALEEQTTEQLENRKKAIQDELEATRGAIQGLQRLGLETEQTEAQIAAYASTLSDLQKEQDFINNTALELAAAREAEAEAAENELQAIEDATAAREQVVADEIALGQERANAVIQTLQDIAAAEKAHTDELVKISENAAAAERKVMENLQDNLVKLREDAGRREADAVAKEQRKILDAQIKSQRQAVDDAESHVQQLQDIQQKANEDEIGLQQKRDFRGVANARRNARRQIQDAQKNFARQQKDRTVRESRDADDRQRAFAQERADRLQKFNQDITDARRTAQQQRIDAINAGRAAINDARARQQQELMDIRNTGIRALELRKQLAQTELQIIGQMTGSAQQLFGQLNAQLASFANTGATTNNTTTNNNNAVTNNVGAINVGSPSNAAQIAILAGVVQ